MKGRRTVKFIGSVFFAAAVSAANFPACAREYRPAYTKKELNEQLVMATLWMQRSAEYRALCHQAYNVARTILDEDLRRNPGGKKRAVIVDADETILEAARYEAYLIGKEMEYPDAWVAWVDAAAAEPLAGALEFLRYAESRGVETFYISNRKVEGEQRGTVANLRKLGFPFADDAHVISRRKGEDSDKSGRRNEVMRDRHVVLLLGDNLDDFSGDFYKKTVEERLAKVETHKERFGRKFVLLPNPMYGTWEEALLDHQKGLPPREKDRIRKDWLRPWPGPPLPPAGPAARTDNPQAK